jgi:serine/threonine protein kinase
MAPEVCTLSSSIFTNSEGYNGRKVDIWALGILLFILEFGLPPWKQANRENDRFFDRYVKSSHNILYKTGAAQRSPYNKDKIDPALLDLLS